MTKQTQSTWRSQFGYIWAMIGSAVGFANILGFSAKCYANGGGAFLIPLLVAFLVLGLPLLYLEGVLGQSFRLPLVSAYQRVGGAWGKFFGWLTVLGLLTIGGYYLTISGWTFAYCFFATFQLIPADTETFFFRDFLGATESVTAIGDVAGLVLLSVLIVAALTWWVTVRRIDRGIEVICEIFLPLLSGLIVVCAVAVAFLPGALTGLYYYVNPDFSSLYQPGIWLTAFGHVFFSLSVGLGIIVGYSRYTDDTVDIRSAMLYVALGDLLTSLISGFVIFGGIGYMAESSGLPFSDVVSSNTFGLGFVVLPKILQTLNPYLAAVVGSLFFLSLFIAGASGLFSIVEAIAGNVEVEFRWSRTQAVSCTVIAMTLVASSFTAGNGAELIGVIDGMTAGVNVLISGLAHIGFFLFICRDMKQHPIWYTPSGKRRLYYFTVKYVSPMILLCILFSILLENFSQGISLDEAIRWAWLTGASLVALGLSRIPSPAAK